MPIYEYRCKQCCHEFEQLTFSSNDPAPDCPQCGHKEVTRLMSTGAIRPCGIPTGAGGFAPPACKTPRGGG